MRPLCVSGATRVDAAIGRDRNRGLDRGGTVRRVSSADREREKEMIKTSSRGRRHGSRTRERPRTHPSSCSHSHAIRGGGESPVAHADIRTSYAGQGHDTDRVHTRRDPTPTGHGTTGSRGRGSRGRVGTPHPARRARPAEPAAPPPRPTTRRTAPTRVALAASHFSARLGALRHYIQRCRVRRA